MKATVADSSPGGSALGGDFSEPEIENLGVAAAGDENVGRLDIAMNDALGMRGVERRRGLDGKVFNGFDFQRRFADLAASE